MVITVVVVVSIDGVSRHEEILRGKISLMIYFLAMMDVEVERH